MNNEERHESIVMSLKRMAEGCPSPDDVYDIGINLGIDQYTVMSLVRIRQAVMNLKRMKEAA